MSQWVRADFKGKPVWASVDAAGQLVAEGGRVPIRYSDKPGAKVYRAGASRITPSADAPRDLPDGVSADASQANRRGRAAGFG